MQTTIVWFRQDLRIEDQPALTAALEKKGAVICLYLWSPEEEGGWAPGGASRWWLHHSLIRLSEELRTLNLELIIRAGKPLSVLKSLSKESHANAIYWNRRYEPQAIERDSTIKSVLTEQGLEVKSFNGTLLYEPWTIANKQNRPFQVFTPFWKQCLQQSEVSLPLPLPAPSDVKTKTIPSLDISKLRLLPKIHWDSRLKANWQPGTANGLQLLRGFAAGQIKDYQTDRDYPDLRGTSRLSPYLHFGEVSVRMVWQALKNSPKAEIYLRQLGWREFAYYLLYHFPKTPREPLRAEFAAFPWNDNNGWLHSWQKGMTGFPIVDAGMRELWTTGWMHNRVRMIVGSFLVKDLLLPWQKGAEWFWDTLVDADLANNTLGWQWVGGCGADAAPYFRIFNPMTQGEKFDRSGDYTRKWVPELANLPNKWLQRPWEAPEEVLEEAEVILGKTYPKPIVDHPAARLKALEAFKRLREG